MAPEQEARAEIDKLLRAAGWSVQPRDKADLNAAQGIAICEYSPKKAMGSLTIAFTSTAPLRVADRGKGSGYPCGIRSHGFNEAAIN